MQSTNINLISRNRTNLKASDIIDVVAEYTDTTNEHWSIIGVRSTKTTSEFRLINQHHKLEAHLIYERDTIVACTITDF